MVTTKERKKACGYEYHCPLVDEFRLYAEGQELILGSDLPREKQFQLVAVIGKAWCKGHQSHNLKPHPERCREITTKAAEAFLSATGNPYARMTSLLRRALEEEEEEYSRALREVLREVAPF